MNAPSEEDAPTATQSLADSADVEPVLAELPGDEGAEPYLAPSLEGVLCAAREYLDIEAGEEAYIVVALATAVSNVLSDEEPLWAQLNGASGAGKNEAISLVADVADKAVDEITRAGLLSRATGKRGKRVGLLTTIPRVALVTITDLSSLVTMGDRDARARIYGMLRVVYDGHVYRGIGGEAAAEGEELEWSGHLTLLAGATPAIDAHTSFEAALGERWLTVRLPESTTSRARRRAQFVVDRQNVAPLRRQAQDAAAELIRAAQHRIPARLDDAYTRRLVDVATFVAAARTGVQFEGQGRNRVPVGLPIPEEPTRLVGQLHRLARCGVALGIPQADACDLAVRVAFDSVPLARMKALRTIAETPDGGASIADVHRGLGRGDRYAAIWETDALYAIGLIDCDGPPRDVDPKANRLYALKTEWRDVYESVACSRTSPLIEEEVRGRKLHIQTPPNGAKGQS